MVVTAAVHDDKFYLDDGDFVICVEDTLFKVHKFVLSRDSSTFQNICSSGTDASTGPIEGADDRNPLVLAGDTVSAFKTLLTILYALPDELQEHSKHLESRLEDVAALAAIANKYHFVSTEKFALKILQNLLQKSNSHLVNNLTSDALQTVYKSITRLNERDLETDFVRMFAKRVLDGDIKPQIVFEFAETHLPGLRPVLGAAYYTFLIDLKETLPTKNAATKLGADQGCADGDLRIRLLTGYWSLTQLFDHFLYELPLSKETVEKNPGLESCLKHYKHDSQIYYGDVLGLLKSIREHVANEVEEDSEEDVNGKAALAEFDKANQTFQDNLMDHFDL